MISKEIIVRAVKTQQKKSVDIYNFFVKASEILQIADISRIHRDEAANIKGFQRKEIKKHVQGIVDYLDTGDVLFPNAIILAFQPVLEFKQSRGPSPEGPVSGTLSIPVYDNDKRAAWIVDGQQRALALSKTINRDIMVPVVGFVAPDVDIQRQQFILVNKAKPLPRRLINELLPEISAELPHDLKPARIPSEICNFLNTDPKSPFYKLIKRISATETQSNAVVIDTALINLMKHSINNYGALGLFKNTSDGLTDIDAMYKIMCIFWSAVKEVFPEAWGIKPQKSRLMHSAGIQAMGVLMDRIMPRVYKSNNAYKDIVFALQQIAPHCSWTEGSWEGTGLKWNDVQNTPRHIKALAELLVQLDFAAMQEQS